MSFRIELPNDYTRCKGISPECPQRWNCARFRSHPKNTVLSWVQNLNAQGSKNCSHFISYSYHANLLDVSERQDPVVDHLTDTLDSAKATAAAIADNAIDEQRSIPTDLLNAYINDLERIKAHLLTAADVP